MVFRSLRLKNFLSFGESSTEIELKPLNLIVGSNGSGKSNLIEAFKLLKALPTSLSRYISKAGGIDEVINKSKKSDFSGLHLTVDGLSQQTLSYGLKFHNVTGRAKLWEEYLGDARHIQDDLRSYSFNQERQESIFNIPGQNTPIRTKNLNDSESVLSQRKDPLIYPEITYLANTFDQIKIYQDWAFGKLNPARGAQPADLPNHFLEPDGSNLGLVLSQLRLNPKVKRQMIEKLRDLYEHIEDIEVHIQGNTVQVYLQEKEFIIPSMRLSDGTLRYLCLLTILCHPEPPHLICIEEPELGLHPDAIASLGELLIEASSRTQLIVTTHSDILVDALSDQPEALIICDKDDEGTKLRRIKHEEVAAWLEEYSLGNLWHRGHLGGTRW